MTRIGGGAGGAGPIDRAEGTGPVDDAGEAAAADRAAAHDHAKAREDRPGIFTSGQISATALHAKLTAALSGGDIAAAAPEAAAQQPVENEAEQVTAHHERLTDVFGGARGADRPAETGDAVDVEAHHERLTDVFKGGASGSSAASQAAPAEGDDVEVEARHERLTDVLRRDGD